MVLLLCRQAKLELESSADSNGQVIFSAWQAYNRCCDMPETEALACVGLQKAVQGGLSQIIIEMAGLRPYVLSYGK
jgi:hypothetical protein